MKELVLIITLLGSFLCVGQVPVAALEAPEFNLLYRGYPNMIIPAVSNNGGRKVELLGSSNVSITISEDSSVYFVDPGKGRYAYLHVVLIGPKSIDTVKSVTYRVKNLPTPSLYWGASKNTSKASIKEAKLFAKYPPEISLKASFRIISWEITHQGDTIAGKGSNISSAEEFLKQIKEKTTLHIEAISVGPDGVQREIRGQWKVVPWNEDKGGPVVIKCAG